ncbi:MAG: T9SS type A sorting domain-containing protein [Bacteroidota bacterium]
MKNFFTMLTALVLVGLISVSAQDVSVETYGVSPRDAEMDTLDIFDLAYNGLMNVGKETKIYLVGKDTTTLAAPVWSVVLAPAGANTTFGTTQDLNSVSQAISFIPDSAGTYVIKFEGSAAAEITINAGLYLGVKTGSPNCWMCHNTTYNKWAETGHSDILDRALEGTLSDHYASYCIGCHTTGFDPNANNDGFDDWGFVFPDSLFEGMADSMYTTYPDAMARANIQCESCHGPGSEHGSDVTDSKMVSSLDSKNCAWCHDAGTHHIFPYQWDNSGHANPPSYPGAGRNSCSGCHDGAQFIQFVNGEEITVMETNTPISCAVCHDPHSVENEHQVRTIDAVLSNGQVVTVGGTGKLCMNCHQSRREANSYTEESHRHYGPHYVPMADMLLGTNAVTFGYKLPSSPHAQSIENSCADCHMAEAHVVDNIYPTAGGHSFAVVDTAGAHHVEICEDCHGNVGETFDEKKYYWNGNADHDGDGVEEGLQVEVDGLMEELAALLPHPDTVDGYDPHDDVDDTWTKVELKAAYNYEMVYYDHSHGIHNPAFTVALLRVSIEALKYGTITAGAIQSVTDIPIDQGFQVRVVWTAFGADDGVAKDAVKTYTILRKVTDAVPAKGVISYPTITQIPSDVEVGTTLALAGELWDVVKEVEAIQFIEYSAVVPTLYNTVEGDTSWATFKVLGKTGTGIIAETDPMDGYSTDDLAPAIPTNLQAQVVANGVMLVWDEAVDKDFNFFEVYRSEEQGFVPSSEKLLSTTTNRNHIDLNVEEGNTYYYVVTAKDFSLNMSGASSEVYATITEVGAEAGIPTEYALNQNYPNPFNPSTAIKFAIPQEANVSLVIYDMIGNQVDVLVNNHMSAGYYTFTWNAANYASGIYFCQMKANDFIRVNKMLLIK